MRILAVIPARGGSKGIPRKNVRLMNGKPLIYYSIENAKRCTSITDIVVTTDDDEICNVIEPFHVNIIHREKKLAMDNTTLDPVVYDAIVQMENRENIKYDAVVTLQATSPLLKLSTLEKAIENFLLEDVDTYISAVNKVHLAWGKNDDSFLPLYEKRLNRQQLPPRYEETGAFLISKRHCINENTRIGNKISIFEMDEKEAIDIDNYHDWILCEHELKKKKILFRADGYKKIGMGHIYHCLTLAYSLTGHDILFVTNENYKEGLIKIQNSFMPYRTIQNDGEFFQIIEQEKPDIIVHDCLNTHREYMMHIKSLGPRLVTIEDLGEGAQIADAAINALYENVKKTPNVYSGEKYICLRDEFMNASPKKFSSQVKEVLVLFGGTDPCNLTDKVYRLAKRSHDIYPEIKFTFITGLGYDVSKNHIVTLEDKNITVIHNTNYISQYMKNADLAFTSQGRTVYELAFLGVPAIVMAQNERETLHTFAQMKNGFLNLGLGSKVLDETLQNTFDWIVNVPQIREEMSKHMLAYDLKSGIERVKKIILGEEFYG
jgi:CMP-N-acetylneuraminic acid synthetase/spore coat polysaccharide biosynthesis predicted glycosyltransferase SpsG